MLQGENLDKVKRALTRTFQVIGGDVMSDGSSMSRAEVCELVLDANYIDTYGGLDKNLLSEFQTLSYDQRYKIAESTFTFKRYCL